jgi:biotin-(acetyl-CoA carboxylase) ligase
MRYWTDVPETTAALLPADAHWQPADQSPPPLWSLLANNRPAWLCTTPDTPAERDIYLIDHAPVSQFDQLLTAHQTSTPLPDSVFALALSGERHRGQGDRAWSALRGNLHLTCAYALDQPAKPIEAALTMCPAVAAAMAIEQAGEGQIRPGIKWVNDVLVNHTKVAGVLTSITRCGERIDRVLFGIGINVRHTPALSPAPGTPPAGDLSGYGLSLASVWHTIHQQLDHWVDQIRAGQTDAVYHAYHERAIFLGREVEIWPKQANATQPIARGTVTHLHPDLSLELDTHPHPIRDGRMLFPTP